MKNPTTVLERRPCASAHIRIANLKYNCDDLELVKEKRGHFQYFLFCPKEIFLTFVFYFNV